MLPPPPPTIKDDRSTDPLLHPFQGLGPELPVCEELGSVLEEEKNLFWKYRPIFAGTNLGAETKGK